MEWQTEIKYVVLKKNNDYNSNSDKSNCNDIAINSYLKFSQNFDFTRKSKPKIS